MWTLQGYARNGSMRDYVLVPSEIIDKDAYIQNCHELIDEKNKELAASRLREELLKQQIIEARRVVIEECLMCPRCGSTILKALGEEKIG